MKLTEYVDKIINGPGGWLAYVDREGVSDEGPVGVATFVLRCLANLDCEGSGEVVEAIAQVRNERAWKRRCDDFNARSAAGKLEPGEKHPDALLDLG